MHKLGLLLGVIALLTAATAGSAAAATTNLRMATLAPDGSVWGKYYGGRVASEIRSQTADRVGLKWYAGRIHGEERDIVRKIGLGQLDGGGLSGVGLGFIEPSIRVLELPRLFESVDEFDFVAAKMWPYFQQKFAAKGYRLLSREETGSARLMSKDRLTGSALPSPRMRPGTFWRGPDDAITRALWRELKANDEALGFLEVPPALTDGRIDAFSVSPLTAVTHKWTAGVKYLSSLRVSYGIGATVVKSDVLTKLSAADQQVVVEQARKLGPSIRKQVRSLNTKASQQMQGKGIQVADDAGLTQAVDKAARTVRDKLTDTVYTRAELVMVADHIRAYRDANPPT